MEVIHQRLSLGKRHYLISNFEENHNNNHSITEWQKHSVLFTIVTRASEGEVEDKGNK